MTTNEDETRARDLLPLDDNVAMANPEQQVFDAMLSGWENQQYGRGLSRSVVGSRSRLMRRFSDFCDLPPWRWRAKDLDEFTAELVAEGRARSTVRGYHCDIRVFCDYLTSPHYDWMEVCEQYFGAVPSQVCMPWNTIVHRFEFEGGGQRRPLTYDEVEALFDAADARVSTLVDAKKKGALGALRDAQLLKTVYAFGLRRTEAVKLDVADLHHNAQVKAWGRYASLHVRWAKAGRGGGPRRRTVLLVPEFDWWIEGMRQWVEEARDKFGPGELNAMWVTERRTQVTPGYLDRRFSEIRDEAGLPSTLTLHSLRHSYVTHLMEFGYAPRFIQEQVGHMHASTTSIYASTSSDYKNHVLRKALERLAERHDENDDSKKRKKSKRKRRD